MIFQDWGLIDYEQALKKQLDLVEETANQDTIGTIVFCSHPAVVTLGRATQAGDVFDWQGPIKEISRGGRATYHGPSQLVIYPILNLRKLNPRQDIGYFLRGLETAVVNTLASYGVQAQGRSLQKKSALETHSEETGVWVGEQKIASLGIGVRKWVTYHGAAINLDQDPAAFQGLKPCGFSAETMISLENLLKIPIPRSEFRQRLRQQLLSVFDLDQGIKTK